MEEKKQKVVNGLIEKGHAAGKLSMNDIDAAIAELDLELDELNEVYDTLENNNIEIVDDLNFDVVGETKEFSEMSGEEIINAAATFDPVKEFLREIGRIPLLTPEEEIELAIRISEGDEEAKKKLAESNLQLVGSIARRYVGRGMHFLDLVSAGSAVLMTAAEQFDHTRGLRFSTYATSWIRQAITRALKEHLDEDPNSEKSSDP